MIASLDDLLARHQDRIVLRAVSGSHAYGLATADSDRDERGVFAPPALDYVALEPPLEHLQDDRGDTVFYGLRKLLALASAANPAALELLFSPMDCLLLQTPAAAPLLAARGMFVSDRCIDSYAGYARAQIRRARGQNKWINNPQPEHPPVRDAFCWVILGPWPGEPGTTAMPLRPQPLATSGLDLAECHCASLEHVPRTYRLYHYGPGARGVFRDGNLVCESIPQADEATRLRGLLIHDQAGFEQAKTDHRNYWQWRAQRNEARWRTQEAGEVDYDAKNMMHTFRLLAEAEHIVANGQPRVRFAGEERDFLLQVRAGAFAYDELLARAESQVAALLARPVSLPPPPEPPRVEALLRAVTAAMETTDA